MQWKARRPFFLAQLDTNFHWESPYWGPHDRSVQGEWKVQAIWFKMMLSRWWQLKYFLFSSLFGEDEPILINIFQMGWNHQPVVFYWCFLGGATKKGRTNNSATKQWWLPTFVSRFVTRKSRRRSQTHGCCKDHLNLRLETNHRRQQTAGGHFLNSPRRLQFLHWLVNYCGWPDFLQEVQQRPCCFVLTSSSLSV